MSVLEHYQPPTRLTPLTVEEFLSREFPPRERILAPWLPVKGLAMIHAYRGIGKTLLAWWIAYTIATGGEFLGWRADRPRKVLLFDGEMPREVLQERLAQVVEQSGVNPTETGMLRLVLADLEPDGIPDLSTEEGQAAFDEVLEDAEVIILDNVSTICRTGTENDAESWAPVQAWTLAKRREGRTVIFIHHDGKGRLQRGTSKREDVLDTVIGLRRPEDYRAEEGARFEVCFDKARGFFGAEAEPFEATLTAEGWARKALSSAVEDRVMALHDDGLTQREIAKEIGKSASTVNRIIAKRSGGDE